MDDTIRNTSTSLPRRQKHKNYRHLQTDYRSVGMFPASREQCCSPLEDQDAWGTGRNDHAHRGNIIVLITKEGR